MKAIHVGIGGWNYAPWRGAFYPAGLAQAQELAYASRHVTSIEINATFYGSQKPASFVKWRNETPDEFVFSVKGPRFATYRANLAEAAPAIARFLTTGVLELGDKLGPILWQFPPTRKFDAHAMRPFLEALPQQRDGRKLRHAVEARHPSFADPAWLTLLREFAVAHAIVDSDRHVPSRDVTAPFVYARLERNSLNEPEGYASDALRRWAERVRNWSANGQHECFVYFISGDKIRAPAAAMAFLQRLAAA
jgi:uncharacterized protein YecE (DUF72 family)